MKKWFFVLVILSLLVSNQASAQSRHGLYQFSQPGSKSIVLTGIGPAFLFGDLGGNVQSGILKDFDVELAKIMFTLSYRYVFPNNIGLNVFGLYNEFVHSDANSRNAVRGYDSKVNLAIIGTHIEYNFIGGEYAQFYTPHTLYVFAGLGVLFSLNTLNSTNPTIPLYLNKLGKVITESNSTDNLTATFAKTRTISPVLPIGVGYDYAISDQISIGAEYTINLPFSDYIDGISPSGSKSADYLMSLNLTLTYKFSNMPNANRRRVIWN